ncbi:MAG: N-acetylneuraminate synthase family protein [Proteobacteria bacterium]|nr:N-acetylneuraminate synthase family protein [Pseudomonadota bacterium]
MVGPGSPCLIVAEIAQAHDGSLGQAHAHLAAAVAAGADAVKFQTHIAAEESTPHEPFRIKFSRQDASRYEYWRRMEFSESQWRGLRDHAQELGAIFLSSPFSLAAVELLAGLEVPAWKVGAGEVTNLPLLELLGRTGRPVLLSSGLATWDELDAAVACVSAEQAPVGVYQCTTAYPCPPERLGLNVLAELRARYGCPVGLSDHSATVFAGLAAATLGANLLEVHLTLSRHCFGPDVSASLTPEALAELVRGVRFIEAALRHPVDKVAAAGDLSDLRQLFSKSIVVRRALPAGHRLSNIDLALKKPGSGLPPARLAEVVGRVLRHSVEADHLLALADLE